MNQSASSTRTQAVQSRGLQITWIDAGMLIVTLIWGINFTVVKQTLHDMLPMVFVSMRFVLASIFVAGALIASGEDLRFDRRDAWRFLLLGLIGNAMYQTLFIQGIARTTASNSSLLLATTPIFVTLLSALFRLEKVSLGTGLGVALSFFGTALIVGLGSGRLSLAGHTFSGNLLTLGATLCWSAYTLMAKPVLRRYSPLKMTALSMMMGTPFLVLFSAGELWRQDWLHVSWQGWAGFGYSFLLAVALSYVIWNTSVRKCGNARTAVYSNLTPVVAVTVSWLFLGETLGTWQIIGAVVTLTGVTLTRVAPRQVPECET
jgi:drug/metabolite transporter (DMT)-like permease